MRAKLKNGLGNLPRIPAGRLGARADGKWGPLSADIEYYRVFDQGRVAALETHTPGYDMLTPPWLTSWGLAPKPVPDYSCVPPT